MYGIADHDHLDVQINRFGFQRGACAEKTRFEGWISICLLRRTRFSVVQTPGSVSASKRVDDEVAAVGLHDGSGLDLGEIGPPDAVPVDHAFDGAEEVLVAGIGLDNDEERPWSLALSTITLTWYSTKVSSSFGSWQAENRGLRFFFLVEPREIVEDVLLDVKQDTPGRGSELYLVWMSSSSSSTRGTTILWFRSSRDFFALRSMLRISRMMMSICASSSACCAVSLVICSRVISPASTLAIRLLHAHGVAVDDGAISGRAACASLHLHHLEAFLFYLFLKVLQDAALPVLEMFQNGFCAARCSAGFQRRRGCPSVVH